ncbi:hypothetical protein [Variovorax sp. YR216]|uniref:hypothetical protein n=1 Tax=Variovorax sp. YR216 TaxID=1882828 RepID=UPI00089B1143|nr:hypothetical protein [Variovorax sp. YR216]SEA49861.1 hypothetical protein SAMN05444680_102661 [Variovorax sp. YR216]
MNELAPGTHNAPPHTPRPLYLASAGHEWQRRFGPSDTDAYAGVPSSDRQDPSDTHSSPLGGAIVFRDAGVDLAELQISVGRWTDAKLTLRLDPNALRELAARLLDAAHDIECAPATVLAPATRTEDRNS